MAISCQFYQNCSRRSRVTVVIGSVRRNKMNMTQKHDAYEDNVGWQMPKKPQNSSSNHCHGRAWCWIQVYPGTPPTLCRVQLPLRWIFSPSLPGLTSTNTPPSAAMYPCCSSKFLITTQQHNEDYYYYYYYYY